MTPPHREPISFSFDITNKFKPLVSLKERHFEKIAPGIYQSIEKKVEYVSFK